MSANEENSLKDKEEFSESNFPQYTLFDIKIDPGLKDDEGNEIPRPFTKTHMRKWLKKVKWENRKAEKRAQEKARAKARRREAREANIDIGPNRKALKKMKLERPKRNIGIIIDLSFDNLMIEKDRFKVIKQILRCYSINRRSATPLQFHITSFGEKSKSDIARHNGYENWDIEYHEESYLELFSKDKIVYLTSESDNVIENFEEDTYYVIGGLVDHNQHKGLCYRIAKEQGIRHGQLPLDKYINMKTRKVLTIDHVFEIVLKVCEGVSWQNALIKVLPLRKGAHVCDGVTDSISSVDVSCDSENDN
ncbi:tRNA methyltransferase 10 homolog A [Pectinophora gossypiella]|uniref:tRNA methyltransferase 10 homolog A n=1 Tax=Pectinophora gossypiella TaxID=13191 RepID=UPI00214F5B84|nr:tRNA methyltransferase 10 homolog A [Pectinophora gossypiella]XP_049867365.1 tRNA methyltransferase 10 homolog A [Pectinophora gossypiella]